MGDMEEDRVYDDRRAETVAYVASGQGVATVHVASDRVGRFSLAHRCSARDVAALGGRVFVATDDGVFAGPGEFESTGFDRPAVAVGCGDACYAADETGELRRYDDDTWTRLGSAGDVRAISGDLVATDDGVVRVDGDDLVDVGLHDVTDVTAAGVPLAAAGDGLYRLGNGWLRERDDAFSTVGSDGRGDRAHAATADELYEHGGDGWTPVDLPVDEPVVDVAYDECVYALTATGTFLVEADPERTADGAGGWRSRALGLPDVRTMALA